MSESSLWLLATRKVRNMAARLSMLTKVGLAALAVTIGVQSASADNGAWTLSSDPWVVPPASSRVSRVPLYSGSCCVNSSFMYGAFTLFGRLSQNRSITLVESRPQSATPAVLLPLVWPLPISLATTPGITFVFFSCRYLDVSVHDVYLPTVMYWL